MEITFWGGTAGTKDSRWARLHGKPSRGEGGCVHRGKETEGGLGGPGPAGRGPVVMERFRILFAVKPLSRGGPRGSMLFPKYPFMTLITKGFWENL